ncbi:MAG: PKD domain-containing protein [Methanocalculaceae archaeon]|jgi:PKD repeat protein|nr:PKD domain-containing protein [Methanocalculaceae archaeon]
MRKILILFLIFGLVIGLAGTVSAADKPTSVTQNSSDNTKPKIQIEVSPDIGSAPLKVTFTATVIDSTSIERYWWEFGDGNLATVQNTTHIYEKAGTYTANFTAIRKDSPSEKQSVTIRVDADTSAYKVVINATPVQGTAPLKVSFKLSTTIPDDDIDMVEWKFGVDASSRISKDNNTWKAPAWTYADDGTYIISLTIKTHSKKEFRADPVTITVSNLVASFIASQVSGPPPLVVKLTDTSRGAASWVWTIYKMNDQNTRNAIDTLCMQNITYTFDSEGKYEVELLVMKDFTSVITYKTITVKAKATTAPTTTVTTTAIPTPEPKTNNPNAAGKLLPNPIHVIDEFIRLLLAMLNPAKYRITI